MTQVTPTERQSKANRHGQKTNERSPSAGYREVAETYHTHDAHAVDAAADKCGVEGCHRDGELLRVIDGDEDDEGGRSDTRAVHRAAVRCERHAKHLLEVSS